MFRKILIANRGEIAVRILRACREMGIRTVAVFSEVDRASLHVLKADEAYPIGPAPATESYLRIDKIIDVAGKSGADAIHPGYGFLSENPELARACEAAGIVFIGPSPAALEKMGSKTRAREIATASGVPVVPGTTQAIASPEAAQAIASTIGYPVMLKAAAGGGGKGLRRVQSPDEMPAAFRDARSEAKNAFGDSRIYIEKYLEKPRHIEVQVFGDRDGNVVHLGDRECSIQRRHQKVMEESPAPFVDSALRRSMGEAAVKVARAADYYNAGTVEFLVDAEHNYFFLEINTRLQVEHPVTEAVTGLDLVKLQIQVAQGEPLPLKQEDVLVRGAAVECRVYAEDPANNFFPCPGTIRALETPSGPGVRDDSGIYPGWTVPVEYDPLISKLVSWGATRAEAIERLRRALDEYYVGGIQTNLGFFRTILGYSDFLEGRLDTGFIDRLLAWQQAEDQPGLPASSDSPEHLGEERMQTAALAAVLFATAQAGEARHDGQPVSTSDSRWKLEGRRHLLRQWPPDRKR